MSDTEVRVDQAVSAVVGKAMAAVLVPVLLGFWGWVGLTLKTQGEMLAEVKTTVDQTKDDVASVRVIVDKNRSDIYDKIGQIVDVASEEKTETERLKQALEDHEAADQASRDGRMLPSPRTRGN